jgi:hypothetical protein
MSTTGLSTATGFLADVGGIAGLGAALALWFDENQAYKSSGGGIVTPDSILTYTAPSPKLVYGATGVLGYAPHNRLLQSQTFDNASWLKAFCSVTANAAVAPDGSATADLIIPDAASNQYKTVRGTDINVGTAVATASIYAKASGYGFISFVASSTLGRLTIELSSGAYTNYGAALTATSTAVGDGWYRVVINVPNWTTLATTWWGPNSIQRDPATSWTSDGVSGAYLWGAQLNAGSSALTYIPTTTAAVYSLPRDYNPTTGAALGVLVEEQRTNLLTYSEQFDNAAWVKTFGADVGVTATAAVAPDGTNTADLVWAAEANGYHNIRQGVTVAGAVQSWSVYVKAQNYNKVGIREDFAVGQYATFLLSGSGSVIDKTGGTTAAITALVNSWYRITFTGTSTSANMGIGIYIMDAAYTTGDPSSYNYTGNGTSGLYLWGAQQEAGAFATSYIPTVASQVTRAADQISILTSAFPYSATESTMVAEYRAPSLAFSQDIVWIADGLAESLGLYTLPNNAVILWTRDGGVTQTTPTIGTMTGTTNKAAAAWKLNDFAGSLNGAAVATDASGTMPTPTELKLNPRLIASTLGNIHIKRLAYYASRKSNAELQVLST